MAKGKKASGKHYVSKGSVGVNKSLNKAVRRERSELDNLLNAFDSWKRGSPTPKRIQKIFGMSAYRSYKDWARPPKKKGEVSYE
jgi:hypothetical protein